MSFRAEVSDFLGAATKVNDMVRKNKDSNAKNNYYDALIKNQQTTADFHNRQLSSQEGLARDRLKLQRDQLSSNNSFRQGQLGVQRDRTNMMRDYYGAKAQPRAGAVDTGPGTPSRLFGGTQGGVPNAGAVPFTGAGAVPGNPALPTGAVSPYDANAEGSDEELETAASEPDMDGDDEELDYAEGGVVGKSPTQPAVPLSDEAQEDDTTPPTARDVNANRERRIANRGANADRMTDSGGTSTSGGFNLANTLAGWATRAAPAEGAVTARDTNVNRTMRGAKPGDSSGAPGDSNEDPSWYTPPAPVDYAPSNPGRGVGSDRVASGVQMDEPAAPVSAPAKGIGSDRVASGQEVAPAPKPAVDTAPVPTNANPGASMNNPVALGVESIIKHHNLGRTGVDVDGKAKRLGNHETGYTDSEIAAINKAVDPDGELSESAKVIARLDAATKFHLAKGDPKKAAQMAQSLLAYGGMQASKFGAAAARAIQSGKNDEAAKYISLGLDQVPDGRSIGVAADKNGVFHATATDPQSGEVSDLGNFDTKQVMKLALGLSSGQEYYQRLAQIASGNFGKVTKQGNPRDEKVPPLADRTKAFTGIEESLPPELTGKQLEPTLKAKSMTPDQFHVAKTAASDVLRTNNTNPREAFGLVNEMIDPDAKTQAPMRTQPLPNGGMAVQFNNKVFKLSREATADIGNLANAVKKARAAEQAAKDKRTEATQREEALFKEREDRVRGQHRNARIRQAAKERADEIAGGAGR